MIYCVRTGNESRDFYAPPVLMRIQKGRLAWHRLVLSGLVLLQGTEAREAEISPPHGQTPVDDNAAPGNTLAQKEKTDYKVLMMGEAVDEDVHLGITDLLASDGVGVREISSQFPSDVAAQKYFKKVLSRALSVSERGDKKIEPDEL